MEQTFKALGGLFVNAIPTVIFVILLHWFLKVVLFGPLKKIMKQREALTEGTRKAAEDALAAAERKTAEYETKFREARAEVYKEQELMRQRWMTDQAAQVAQSKAAAEASIAGARAELAAEVETARKNLLETSTTLADQIATSILPRSAQ
ncbi:MAG TPA: ATP synthase F0 subunit B [Bryobacteraceae bacterium]|jgi:F-type H+-transporting ATPase subunit b